MGKFQRRKLEQFFRDLEQWNRVVVKDAQSASDEGYSEAEPDHSQRPGRQTFIRVGCDLDSAEPKPDAKLA